MGIVRKFLSNVKKRTHGCWDCLEWQGAGEGKYGQFCHNKKTYVAHRVSYAMFVGELRTDRFVCHHCDNPRCVNPNHLFLGTQKDNMMDAASKMRCKSSNQRLDDAKVLLIIEKCKAGVPIKDIALEFGVSDATITMISRGKRWKHLGHCGEQRKKQPPKRFLTDEQKSEIKRLGKEGLKQRDIAAAVGCSQGTVWKALNT